jgi:membrane protein implicated in regulation of membrane protease activity
MFYFWLGIVVFLGILEIATVGLVSIWFVISGIVAMILSFITNNFAVQFGVFVLLGVILMLTTRKTLTKYFSKSTKTNLDRVVGMQGIVTEEIRKNEVGEVKVDGKKWSAIADNKIEVGSIVKILKINGVKLKVEVWKE